MEIDTIKKTTGEEDVSTSGVVRGIKNFRQCAEIENFYRFILENNLRREASMIFGHVVKHLKSSKKRNRRVQ